MMRIFLLGVNCILITSLALLRNARHFPVVFVLLFKAIEWHNQSVAHLQRDPATIPITIVSRFIRMHRPHRNGVCRASRLPTCLLCMTSCNQFAWLWLYDSHRRLHRNHVIARCAIDRSYNYRLFYKRFIKVKSSRVRRWFRWNDILRDAGYNPSKI